MVIAISTGGISDNRLLRCVLVDPRLAFRPCGIAGKHIGGQQLIQGFCDLTAAGIVDKYKGYSGFLVHGFPQNLLDQLLLFTGLPPS